MATYNGTGNGYDCAHAIELDESGNVYITGESMGEGDSDYVTIKYDTNGNEIWIDRYDGPGSPDSASSILVDRSGNVYITGGSVGSGTSWDYTTIKYSQINIAQLVPNNSPKGHRSQHCNGELQSGYQYTI